MNKKQRNRKLVAQNSRNRIINRRYESTIKTLSKLFSLKLKQILSFSLEKNDNTSNFESIENTEIKQKLKGEIVIILNRLYSVIDKAVKKKVVHKNTAARKKSRIGLIFSKL